MASDGTDLDQLKRQNEDLREQLRAVELSHNENDRTHRAIVAQYSNRAEHAEVRFESVFPSSLIYSPIVLGIRRELEYYRDDL